MRKISRTEGVPADSCRSCMHEIKLLAQNPKIHEQIYLLTARKGLSGYVRSWRSVSMVTLLKENSILNTSLLLSSIYVHVLVRFIITFSRSGTCQLYYFVIRL